MLILEYLHVLSPCLSCLSLYPHLMARSRTISIRFFGNKLCVSIILINNIAAWGTPGDKRQVPGILDDVSGTSGCTERQPGCILFLHLNVELHDFNSLASFPSFIPLYGSHVPSYIQWNLLPQALLKLRKCINNACVSPRCLLCWEMMSPWNVDKERRTRMNNLVELLLETDEGERAAESGV